MGRKTLPDHLGCLHSKSFYCLIYTLWDTFDIAYVDRVIQISTNRKFVNRVPFTGQETSFLPGIDRRLTPFFRSYQPLKLPPAITTKTLQWQLRDTQIHPCLSREPFEHTIGEKRSLTRQGRQTIDCCWPRVSAREYKLFGSQRRSRQDTTLRSSIKTKSHDKNS